MFNYSFDPLRSQNLIDRDGREPSIAHGINIRDQFE